MRLFLRLNLIDFERNFIQKQMQIKLRYKRATIQLSLTVWGMTLSFQATSFESKFAVYR
eukprot:UN03412